MVNSIHHCYHGERNQDEPDANNHAESAKHDTAVEQQAHPYDALTPDLVMDAVESLGLLTDQRVFALNSYENRVYQVGIDEASPVIVKFYRPERWSREAILEEHSFSQELKDTELSVVAPERINCASLHHYQGFDFAIFARQGGYAPEIDNLDTLYRLGTTLGRMHQVATQTKFKHRRSLSIEQWAIDNQQFLLQQRFIPNSLVPAYQTLSDDLISAMQKHWARVDFEPLRLHGDCHIGNILWRDDCAHFVDFDDCIMGPAIQDIWLFLSGDRQQQSAQLMEFVEGYEEFYDFDPKQLRLIETLRTLRMMNYAGWLAKRWQDPAFPMHFPWFNSENYWSTHILELREQLAKLDEDPLKLHP